MGTLRHAWGPLLCSAIWFGTAGPIAAADHPELLYRLNAGGPAFEDAQANRWRSDSGFFENGVGIHRRRLPAAGTADPLYHSERFDPAGSPTLVYRIPVDSHPGRYQVALHFAEIDLRSASIGARVFDVLIEGQVVLDDYDIFAAAGFRLPDIQTFEVIVSDGELTIDFAAVQGLSKISGLEVFHLEDLQGDLAVVPAQIDFAATFEGETATPGLLTLTNIGELNLQITAADLDDATHFVSPTLELPLVLAPQQTLPVQVLFAPISAGDFVASWSLSWETLTGTAGGGGEGSGVETIVLTGTGLPTAVAERSINVGGRTFVEGGGVTWESDAPFAKGGRTLEPGNPGQPPIPDATLSRRDGDYDLRVPVASGPGIYVVTLHFRDRRTQAPGERVFDVEAEDGQPLLRGFDPYAAAGNDPWIERFALTLWDGVLDLALIDTGGGEPTLSGIEIGLSQRFEPRLDVSPPTLSFSSVLIAAESAPRTLTLTNTGEIDLTVDAIVSDGPEFLVEAPELPIVIASGASVPVGVSFRPAVAGPRTGTVTISSDDAAGLVVIAVDGVGYQPPPPTTIYRINAGGPEFVDPQGNTWSVGDPYHNGAGFNSGTGAPISGTDKSTLYQTAYSDKWGDPDQEWTLPVFGAGGYYRVILHFAEFLKGGPGERVFTVELESQAVLSGWDIAAAVGTFAATTRSFDVASDAELELRLVSEVDLTQVNAIEVEYLDALAQLSVAPSQIDWGHVVLGNAVTQTLKLTNGSPRPASLDWLRLAVSSGSGLDFSVELDGQAYPGAADEVIHSLSGLVIAPGGTLDVPITYQPTVEAENSLRVELGGEVQTIGADLHAAGGQHPFLHVVIVHDDLVVDYDQDGSGHVALYGSGSHTHEPSRTIVFFEWAENGTPFSSAADVVQSFPLGEHTVSLMIQDDNDPPESLTDTSTFRVVAPNAVPGALVQYYDGSGPGGPDALLDAVPATADWIKTDEGLRHESITPFELTPILVQVQAILEVLASDTYDFPLVAGGATRLLVDGQPWVGPASLSAGLHAIEARFAVASPADLPLAVMWSSNGGPAESIPVEQVTHDRTALRPVINEHPDQGPLTGGFLTQITGLGFTPESQVVVHWGAQVLVEPSITVTPDEITILVPPGAEGFVDVFVVSPNGASNRFTFEYTDDAPPPIDFDKSFLVAQSRPTAVAWGPDERLYVSSMAGTITAYRFDDDYNVLEAQVIHTIANQPYNEVLGLAFSPWDAADPPRLYVAVGELFFNGGWCFQGFSPYTGAVSVLTGPDFDVIEPLVTGLPVSNHDHSVNGMDFDHEGNLLVCIGGNTNAGVPSCAMGDLPESPLSGAILKLPIRQAGFNGAISYVETSSGTPNDDQVFGDIVDVAPGVDVSVFASGFRNTFDLVFTTEECVYATDNGPNVGFGPESTGPDTEDPDPGAKDELLLIEEGLYYGHPNRNRGRTVPIENLYYGPFEPEIPGSFAQTLLVLPSSTDGIVEYRAETFQGAMRGNLLVQTWNGGTRRLELAPDGRSVTVEHQFLTLGSLALETGPGGVFFSAHQSGSVVDIVRPNDPTLGEGLVPLDIHPWRAPATGGHPFVIAGVGFGNFSNTTVTIGGIAAQLTAVTPTRIRGLVPPQPAPTSDLVDIVIDVGGEQATLTRAFRYLF